MVNAVNINSALRLGPSKSVGSPSRESPSFCPQKKNSPGKHREGRTRTTLKSVPVTTKRPRYIYIFIFIHTKTKNGERRDQSRRSPCSPRLHVRHGFLLREA